jgi:hypothetical protein
MCGFGDDPKLLLLLLLLPCCIDHYVQQCMIVQWIFFGEIFYHLYYLILVNWVSHDCATSVDQLMEKFY